MLKKYEEKKIVDQIPPVSPLSLQVQCELCPRAAYWIYQERYSLCKNCVIKYHSTAKKEDLVHLSIAHVQNALKSVSLTPPKPSCADLKNHKIFEDYNA